jgi:O-antigen chain-terminating methyltransferase
MAANKIPAKGVDITKSMIETCHEKGLDAVHGDTLQYLNTLKDDCLVGMTAFQVVEHVPTDYLVRMIKTAFRKIAPGGVLILETVNSDSLNSLRNFYLDLTHRNPIPPATLKFVAEYAGFKDVRLHYSSLVAEESRLQGGDDNTRKLNDLPSIKSKSRNEKCYFACYCPKCKHRTCGRNKSWNRPTFCSDVL